MQQDIEFRLTKPAAHLADFVDFFWMLENHSEKEQEVVVLPDGRIDLFFSISTAEPYHVILLGLGTQPEQNAILSKSKTFAVSFKLPAVEYILNTSAASFLNSACQLPAGFWGITVNDLNDFDLFCTKVSEKMSGLVKGNIDERKLQLFNLLYASDGALPVKDLSEKVYWSSRQINRYFNQQFGLSLKAYCNILRFRASFPQLREGKLFPEQNYTDQAHFIREVKKYAGVVPKELFKNKNGRFIQFSATPEK